MEYVWNEGVEFIPIYGVLISMPECKDKQEFKAWCFDREYTYNEKIVSASLNGDSLLKELHKPERKAWLDFTIEHEYVKKVRTHKTVWVNLWWNSTTGRVVVIGINNLYKTESIARENAIPENQGNLTYLKTIQIKIPHS
jgi:hypothetical protein